MAVIEDFTSPSQIWATVQGIDGPWAAPGLPARSADSASVRDGGDPNEGKLLGRPTYADLTLSRPFRRNRDLAVWRQLNDQVAKMRATITVNVEDDEGIVVDTITYVGRLMSVTPPSGDATAVTTPANLDCVWSIESAQ